ncbi:hypothetical protein QTI66_32955 [Variovorax sp. J22R133]|uniref:hypothetical protein n=1 Tax=Variovorax brevis TaxID=3053503 RepID=UPI0025755997|nr:hypothetical protein [Variovorax sp. J22R133]MDM0116939.1 hypothetical protein [Variovorax sp. J22R133]
MIKKRTLRNVRQDANVAAACALLLSHTVMARLLQHVRTNGHSLAALPADGNQLTAYSFSVGRAQVQPQ